MSRLRRLWLPALPLGFLALVLVAPVWRLLVEGLGGAGLDGAEPVRWLDVWQDDTIRTRRIRSA